LTPWPADFRGRPRIPVIDRAEAPANVGIALIFEPPHGVNAGRKNTACRREPTTPFDAIPEIPPLGLPQWVKVDRFDMKRHVRRGRFPPRLTDAVERATRGAAPRTWTAVDRCSRST
jgi:hypothetical protein